MAQYLWLSYAISKNTPLYGGGKGLYSSRDNSLEAGDSCNTATWRFPNHLGTHVDAPRHFYDSGRTLDAIEPAFWVFSKIQLLEISPQAGSNLVGTDQVLSRLSGEPELLLLKTGFCYRRQQREYWENNPGLEPGLAPALRERFPTLRAVGIDSISISSWQNRPLGREAHRAFLNPAQGRPLVLIEDMDLRRVKAGSHISKIIVLPLLVKDADGAPCTVLAEINGF